MGVSMMQTGRACNCARYHVKQFTFAGERMRMSVSKFFGLVFALLAIFSIWLTFRVDDVWLDIAGLAGAIFNAVAARMFWQRG